MYGLICYCGLVVVQTVPSPEEFSLHGHHGPHGLFRDSLHAVVGSPNGVRPPKSFLQGGLQLPEPQPQTPARRDGSCDRLQLRAKHFSST